MLLSRREKESLDKKNPDTEVSGICHSFRPGGKPLLCPLQNYTHIKYNSTANLTVQL